MCSCEQEKLSQLISSQLTVCRKQKNRALVFGGISCVFLGTCFLGDVSVIRAFAVVVPFTLDLLLPFRYSGLCDVVLVDFNEVIGLQAMSASAVTNLTNCLESG